MTTGWKGGPILPILPLVCASVLLSAQSGAKIGEWRSYGGDLASTRYSPLDQINGSNFNTLEVAWRFNTAMLGPRPEYQFEGTPLMVNGVVYSTAGTRRAVVALDAATGEMIWMHSEREGPRGAAAPRQLSGRGLAYWTDGREARVLYVTPGYRLIALDAKTGAPVASFGKDGVVDLKQDDDQEIDLITGEVGLHATPVVARDVVIVGAAHRTGGVPRSRSNVKGYVRGFDVRTGKRLWIFHTIPSPGESLVAVDLMTGKRKWHYQFVHHGIWDMDLPCAPILADITVNGRVIKAVAQPTKQSWLYVFDRVTGQPVWPIEERPVAKGDVPGEWYSPTQPFVTKPPAYDRQGVSVDDLIDFTPELRAEALKVAAKYRIGPIFTPPVVSKLEGPLATLVLPSATGGANWAGGSYDPETHTLYIYSQTNVSAMGLLPPPDTKTSDMNYVQGSAVTGVRRTGGAGADAGADAPPAQPAASTASAAPAAEGGASITVQGLPLIKPPYGRITAIDLDKGDIKWQIAHGETLDTIKNNPALKGVTIPRTGQSGVIGTLVTKTLLIAGESRYTRTSTGQRGAMLRAYDKATGQEVGAVYMPAPQSGSPMTYLHNGRQYLVVAISGGNYSGELLAFRLPVSP